MELSHQTIAVTGATGFLGQYLMHALLARNARVVAVVRNPEKAARWAQHGASVRQADLGDPQALEAAFRGADAVVSNAALISFTRPRATQRTNVQGTRHVFEAMAKAQVRRAIVISSSAVYPPSVRRRDERTPLRPSRRGMLLNSYGASKAAAERVAWQLAQRHGIRLTTFRPCGITGPDDPLLMRALHMVMKHPVVPFPIGARVGVVHAADVAEAVCRALERPEVSSGKAYNLQGETLSLWDLGSAYHRAGGPAPRLRIPIPVPMLLRYDDARARRDLDFSPRSFEAICREAMASFPSAPGPDAP